MIVLDASALAVLLLKEEGWGRVELSSKTAIPELAVIEAMNAIWKKSAKVSPSYDRRGQGKRLKENLKLNG